MRPVYDTQKNLGAVFGASAGWEYPKYFARNEEESTPTYSFRRANWFDAVGDECKALRSSVGLIDVSNYAKFKVSGQDATEWLDRLLTNTIPQQVGQCVLSPMCDARGRIQGDFTITKLDDNSYLMLGAGIAEQHHLRWFAQHAPELDCEVISQTKELAGFNIAGPEARNLLAKLTNQDVSQEALPFFGSTKHVIAGIECLVMRISYSGELGYEIYVPEGDQLSLYEHLLAAGSEFAIRPVGVLALHSLRMEKGYPSVQHLT